MSKEELLKQLEGGLIVSCQALEGEPLHSSFIMSRMALAAKQGGAVAIRANSVEDILEIKKVVDLPIIGLIKRDYENSERYITPTMKEINELIEVGVAVIAMDATNRPQIDGVSLEEKVNYIHSHNTLVMADVSVLEEGIEAESIGFDFVSTTLSGYTSYSRKLKGPDIKLVKELTDSINIPVIAEGRIKSKKELTEVLSHNPFSVVIGGAITRPQSITEYYSEIIKEYK